MQKVKILKNHYQQITKTSKVKKRGKKNYKKQRQEKIHDFMGNREGSS